MSALSIEKVWKFFPAGGMSRKMTPALRGVSFEIDEGEIVTLIGESGSGKTTLGKIVLRLMEPTRGRVVFQDSDISVLRHRQLRGYYRYVQGVFQDPFSSYNPVYKADRVFDVLRHEYFEHVPDAEWHERIEAALESVTLNPRDVLGKYPHQLSGGQQQRLLIARALLLDVKLLVADEIISMLDASTRVDVLNLLAELRSKGLAVLFITHDLSLGNYISDRTVILRRGAVVEMGPTTSVFGNPQHSYTKMLLESVPQLHQKWSTPAELAARRNGQGPGGAPAGPAGGRSSPGRGLDPQTALEPPGLLECESGHFVADDG